MDIISLFTGCGGLDLGFKMAGFHTSWANEFDPTIWKTIEKNHKDTLLDRRSITDVKSSEIPNAIGIIGGPPCQSWSEAGAGRGINDSRGKLFFEYIRILKDKQPLFFLAENVSGILDEKHSIAFNRILKEFSDAGYNVNYALLNAGQYGVPQTRNRVIIVGYNKTMGKSYSFPKPNKKIFTLKDAIADLPEPMPAKEKNYANSAEDLAIPNHEYMTGGFSTIYMSRNRVRGWNEQSFTIQAGGRHAPCHPQAKKMIFIEKDKRIFDPSSPKPYRRLSVRECARVQSFPDDFVFIYEKIADGYKMIGNAVPVNFAYALAQPIYADILSFLATEKLNRSSWKNLQENKEVISWLPSNQKILVSKN